MLYMGTPSSNKNYNRAIKSFEAFQNKIAAGDWPNYDFSKSIYIKNQKPIKVICSKHGEFSITPNNLKCGASCYKCGKDTIGDKFRKSHFNYIGITNHSVSERYTNEELLDITLLKEWYFDVGQDAYNLEQTIMQQYKEFKYNGKKLLKSGHTEMFFTDVLNLQTKETTQCQK